MSADTQSIINQLQATLAQGNQPSFAGVTAPPDPNAIKALLTKMQLQQQLQQADAPTPGPYGYLHDAGKSAFNSVGQQLGTALTGALGQGSAAVAPPPAAAAPASGPPGAPSTPGAPAAPAAPLTTQSAVNAAIQQGKQAYSSMVTAGVPADQAKVSTLKMLVSLGVPGADDALDKANDAALKNANTASETAKNTSQSTMDAADTAGKAFDQTTKTWKTTFTDPNGLYEIQTNGQGEQKRVELKPPPSAAAQAAANLDPTSIQFAADTYRTTGKFPGSFARNPAMQSAALKQVAQDALANGDTAGSIAARTASLKAGGAALDQVTKQESFTGAAVSTLDKNLSALQTLGQKVDSTGSPIINTVINHFNQGVVTDPNTASYVAMLNAVQGEYAKIASNNNGNAPVSDAAKADAKDVINKAMAQGGIAAVRQTMLQESQNRMQAIREAKQGLIGSLSGNAPGAPQSPATSQVSAPAAPTAKPQGAAVAPPAPQNAQGWTLHKDGRGNMAYVSPDGKQFQAVGSAQ